jgi:hypothetical protein
MIDESQVVVAGKTGALTPSVDHTTKLSNYGAALDTTTLPPFFSVTKGVTKGLNMLGNDVWGNCVPCAWQHARMFKALVSFSNNVMTFEKGFRPPHAPYTETLYWQFQISQGAKGPRPNNGCDPVAWATWFFKQGLCDAFGQPNWSTTFELNAPNADVDEVKAAIYEFGGVCASFTLPQKFQSQFNVTPFSYELGDAWSNDGHEMFITGWNDATQLFEVCTWGVIWHATYDFIRFCMTSCIVFVSQEDSARLGINFSALVQACEALADSQGIVEPSSETSTSTSGFFNDLQQDVDSFVSEKHFDDIVKQGKKIVDMALNREAVNVVLHEIVVLLKIAIKDHVL